ncbi:MAG: hypothetical protein HY812_11270 [Planctomycetes bacterium]|nr:hypothetical protein [Planctomycetota bacterium]
MAAFNRVMNGLFDLICLPFRGMPPLVGLTVISLLCGVLLLLLFKYTSPQQAIARVKNRLWGDLHEIRLFKDDFGVISRAIGRLMKENGLYLACCSVALLPMIVVVLPVLFQLDARYGYDPLAPGERVVMNVILAAGHDPVAEEVALALPEGVLLEAGPVRVPATRELVYRLRVAEAGEHEIGVAVGGETYTKRVDAVPGLSSVSPARFNSSRTLDALMFPAEPPWPAEAAIEAITLTHRRAAMLGMDGDIFPWLIIFCVVGLAFGFALKGVFKVNL